MNHPKTPIDGTKKDAEVPDADADADAFCEGLHQSLTTASTYTPEGGSPDSKSSGGDSMVVDNGNFLAQSNFDILISDVTAEYMSGDLSARFEVQYLLQVDKAEDIKRYKKELKIPGQIIGNNKRFFLDLPCRRLGVRNDPSSPKTPLPFFNVFFLVDTGSPYSYVSRQVMEAL
eukprot:CAMPEP_0113518912 /NCGR_PEP_ID=MMETSP0014_2-20120614/43236_1 /TAXON_ID=2857 /ORGANISM="Nitzschia sp." /LENGTH=173 /DNA_ID=CAMNT_0000416589 /DNA_START=89 /DNA_END=611 /DNA_ORIENTATION=+ /assembly_acc=CAM_ASM_000159